MEAKSGRKATGAGGRRTFTLGTLALVLIFTSSVARGQQGSKEKAEQVAKSWLALIDAGSYRQSWSEVAQYLKGKITRQQWVAQLEQVRAPLGAVKSRKLTNVQLRNDLRGLPSGHYASVQYATSFAKAPPGAEVVALMLENGQWRVMAYFPQARFTGSSK